jgi:hypothetical protein
LEVGTEAVDDRDSHARGPVVGQVGQGILADAGGLQDVVVRDPVFILAAFLGHKLPQPALNHRYTPRIYRYINF